MLKLAQVRIFTERQRRPGLSDRPRPASRPLYYAFLSSATKIRRWRTGSTRLERFRVPGTLAGQLTPSGVIPRRLSPIFRDRHELAAAARPRRGDP